MKTRFATYLLTIIACLAAASCVTGIDSTPRVTAADVKRQAGAPTAEQRFLADVKPQPLADWTEGKRFYVTDDKIKLALGATAPAETLAGQTIVYAGCSERYTPAGAAVTDLQFRAPSGAVIVYTCQMPMAELMAKSRVEIPFAIELSVIDEIARKMQGNTYYLLSSDCCDLDGNYQRRRKFVPVVIKSVRPGNSVYPVAVVFSEADGGTAAEAMVYMGLPGESVGPQFDSLFALDNPRLRYPSVSDSSWRNIVGNTVDLDMTREECRLALGAPADVNRWSTGSYLVEVWSYENGAYLRFEDGLLKTYRK